MWRLLSDRHHLRFLLQDATSMYLQLPDDEGGDKAACRRFYKLYLERCVGFQCRMLSATLSRGRACGTPLFTVNPHYI